MQPTNEILLKNASRELVHISKTPILDAEVLLSHTEKISRTELLTTLNKLCPFKINKQFQEYIKERKKGKPIAYSIGHKEFYGLDFFITPEVLIPRPETELLCERALFLLKGRKNLRILDVGTGSGCIAVTLATLFPKAKITAVDISHKALIIASKNAEKHKVGKRIAFIKSDLLEKVSNKKFDLIIANLPYIASSEITDDLLYEPRVALDGKGGLGLHIYARFIKELHNINIKHILLEHDPRQTIALTKLIKKYLAINKITVHKDLAGFDRVMEMQLTP